MSTFLLLAVLWLLKTLITILEFIWSYPWVYTFMSLAILQLINHTVLALVWFKSFVCSFMPPARWRPEGAFITILARVTFNTCMSKFVFFVLQYLSEALVTKLALIRLQPECVSSCSLQCVERLKRLSQYLHLWGFIPKWVSSCSLQCVERLKLLSQYLHL